MLTHSRQAAALKRKRQERDAFLKQQAEQRKRNKKPAQLAEEDSDEEDAGPQRTLPIRSEQKKEAPKLLPLELLESDDEDSTPASAITQKRRKFDVDPKLLVEPKNPKDKRVGSTAYRVVSNGGDPRLAPKAKKQSLNLKQALLRRDRVAKPRGGFFVNKR